MIKIFIVTRGEWADYGIEAIFSTREIADTYLRNRPTDSPAMDEARIEEWELDQFMGAQVVNVYSRTVDTLIGILLDKHRTVTKYATQAHIDALNADPTIGRYVTLHSLESDEHAEKLALEYFAKLPKKTGPRR